MFMHDVLHHTARAVMIAAQSGLSLWLYQQQNKAASETLLIHLKILYEKHTIQISTIL